MNLNEHAQRQTVGQRDGQPQFEKVYGQEKVNPWGVDPARRRQVPYKIWNEGRLILMSPSPKFLLVKSALVHIWYCNKL